MPSSDRLSFLDDPAPTTQGATKPKKKHKGLRGLVDKVKQDVIDPVDRVARNDVLAPLKRDVGKPIQKAEQTVSHASQAFDDVPSFLKDAAHVATPGDKKGGEIALKGLLKAVNVPGNAVRSGLAYASETAYKDMNPLKALGSFVEGAGKGLAGKEHTTFSQAVGAAETGHPVTKKLPIGVETVGSSLLDPLSYLNLGASKVAKAGLEEVAKSAGQDAAEEIVKVGLKKSGKEGVLRKALADAGRTDKQIERTVKAVRKSGRGGVTAAGYSVPGLTAESAAGKTASGARSVVGEAVSKLPGAKTARGIFHRGGSVGATEGIGKGASDELVAAGDTMRHGTEARVRSVVAGVENALKDAGPISQDDLDVARRALDLPEATSPVVQARKAAGVLGKAADQAERKAASTEAYHSSILDSINSVLVEKRQVLADAKDAVANEASKYGSSAVSADRAAAQTTYETADAAYRQAHTAWQEAARTFQQSHAPADKAVADAAEATMEEARAAKTKAAGAGGLAPSTGYDPKKLAEAIKAADKAQKDLESTANKFNTSSTRHGVGQMARILRTQADAAKQEAEQAAAHAEGLSNMGIVKGGATPTQQKLIDALHAVRTQTEATQGDLLHSSIDPGEYVAHIKTPQAREWDLSNPDAEAALGDFIRREPGVNSILNQAGHANKRTLNIPIDKINEAANKLGFEGKYLEDNPVTATVKRAVTAINADEQRKFIESATKIVGEDGRPLLREAKEGEAANLDLTDTIGKKYVGHPEVVEFVNHLNHTLSDPGYLADFAKSAQKVTSVLKQYYIATPSFHARKIAGDLFLSSEAGVRNPVWYERGFKLAHSVGEALSTIKPGEDFADAVDRLSLSDAEKKNVVSFYNKGGTSNFVESEIKGAPAAAGATGTSKAGRALRALRAIPKANKKATSFISNGFRAAVYLNTLDKTGSEETAMQTVNHFLFDYGAVTDSEKKIRSTAIPFYTFMRKNVPLQLEQAVKHPGVIVAAKNLESDAANHGMKEFPKLPVQEASEVVGGPLSLTAKGAFGTLSGALSPLITYPVERGLGVNAFGSKAKPKENWDEFIKTFVNPYAQRQTTFKNKSILRSILGFQPIEREAPSTKTKAKKKAKDEGFSLK